MKNKATYSVTAPLYLHYLSNAFQNLLIWLKIDKVTNIRDATKEKWPSGFQPGHYQMSGEI